MTTGSCSICQRPADREWLHPLTQVEITCARCGRFRMTHGLDEWWKQVRSKKNGELNPDEERLLPYLSAHIRQSVDPILLGATGAPDWKELATAHMSTSVTQKLSRLLDEFVRRSRFPGIWVQLDGEIDAPLFDVGSDEEIEYLLKHLVDVGALDPQETTGPTTYRVTVRGWQMAAPLTAGGVPGTCFVAMAFDPSLSQVYDDGIKPAIEACGLKVVRVDRLEHNGVITDVIMAEILKAQVVVADVTLQRQGVYFEAGFALGLGRIVIWCCREDEIASVHFDTRQYSHVVWKDAADFKSRLEARINMTILRSGAGG